MNILIGLGIIFMILGLPVTISVIFLASPVLAGAFFGLGLGMFVIELIFNTKG